MTCAAAVRPCHVALLLAIAASAAAEPSRPRLPLDGAWQFQLDPKRAGEAGKWFGAAVTFPGKIKVPGAWGAQGYGTETPKVRHHFVGQAWYRRTVLVPENFRGQRLFLTVGSVHRYARAWVNGTLLGEHIGYLSPFEFEITKLAPPGQPTTVALCVDSRQRWDVDCLTGAYDIIDEMFIPWGGITGHVAIEGRGAAWFEDVFIQPRLAPQPARLTARLVGTPPPGATVQLNVRGQSDGGLSVTRPLEAVSTKGGRIELNLPGKTHPNSYWSPERPTLLTARLSLLRGDVVLDSVTTRFGQRVIEIRGPHLYLNGKRLFLRGYGDDCVFPETVAPPADKAVYLKRFRLAKDYGFNYVRHHSHFMPPEYYEAADEIGMFVSPELPIAYLQYYNRAKGPALELFKTEWAAAIRRFRNHPSIFDWCMGNEMWNGVPIAPDLYRIARELDPTRPIIDSDGLVGGGWLDGKRDRPTLDFLLYMFDLGHLPLGRPDRHRFAKPTKPVLSHEMGNYITFPRLDAIERFQHNFKPFWLTPVKAKLEKLGLLAEADTWARNSERLYLLCHKLNIEDLRKNPFASGYHWWLLQDYWTGSNGIVDHYFRPKPEITPALVRRFNAPVVLLLDGLNLTYRGAKEDVAARLLVSNFAEEDLRDATVTWQAKLGNRVVAQQTLDRLTVAQGAVGRAGDVRFELPDTPSPLPLTIEATLASGKGPASVRNDWTAWVYPASAPPKLSGPLYAGPELVHALAPAGAKAMPAGPLPAQAVYVMGQPTLAALDAAAAGACLILLSPHSVFPTAPNRFKTAWWLGNARDNNVGTVVYPNPITDAIAPKGWGDVGWYRLLEGAQSSLLEGFPARPQVLVRGIDVHRLCRDKALLFQARVGKGHLVVCGLNVLTAQKPAPPEKEWLLARLLEHAIRLTQAAPPPTAELPLAFLRERFAAAAPPEGPFVAGFAKLLRNEGETGTWHSFREDNTAFHTCRQTAPGHLVEWQTAPVPKALAGKAVTFVFAGGLGWVNEPKTAGMGFLVNGREVLSFDVTQDRATWKSADGKTVLHFLPRRRLPLDSVGLFYVTVAADLVAAGQPCRLAVVSKGTGSRRWFALNPYADLLGR